MTIKINEKILSLPPYLSTSWSRIAALHMKGNVLAITLVEGETIHVPDLSEENTALIFNYHSHYLEKELIKDEQTFQLAKEKPLEENSIRLAFGTSLEGLETFVQHNPAQADAPDLPLEVLQKIGAIAKIMAPLEEMILPKPEKDCNCFHCQIARALNSKTDKSVGHEEEIVITPEDLHFQQWTIQQTGDNLFCVINRLDTHEKYNVFLGEPIGCTCGKTGCEHILAVLKS